MAQDSSKVLVLHGELEAEAWYREFDRGLVDYLSSDVVSPVVVSSRTLELSRARTPEIRQRLLDSVALDIEEIGFDVVVAVLPSAIEFVQKLDDSLEVPFVLMLPDRAEIEANGVPSNSTAIIGPLRSTIRTTIDQVLRLRPDGTTIEVIAGNHPTNLIFANMVQEAAMDYADQVQFNFHVGESPEFLKQLVGSLPDTATLLSMPYNRYGNEESLIPDSIIREIHLLSTVPAFSFLDSFMALGIVGGHVTRVDEYATASGEVIQGILRGQNETQTIMQSSAATLYDWEAVQKWNLPMGRLQTPFQYLNEPESIWQEYPFLTTLFVNLILVLAAALVLQSLLLKRSRTARLQVEASEKTARQSEEKYRLLANNTLDVIWIWDSNEVHLSYCSPSVENLLGYTVNELFKLDMINIMTRDSAKRCKNAFFSDDPRSQVFEVEYISKTGEHITCEIAVQPTKIANRVAQEWVGISRDITQRKAEEVKRQQLEAQVRQSQKFESLGTLAGGIAHDFNNILSVIMGTADVLKNSFKENTDESEKLMRLMTASEKAKDLVQQILRYSRQSQGEKKVLELNSLIDECVGMTEAGIPESTTIHRSIGGHKILVKGDQSQLSQVIINLLANASEAIQENRGDITISLIEAFIGEDKQCLFSKLQPGSYAKVRVIDNGCGVPSEIIDRIFDPFYTNKELGNGMGLAIVQGIIVEHGGAIEISSSENVGTEIAIYLPITNDALPEVSDENPLEQLRNSHRILVVDDQEDLREMFSSMLDALGHSCTVCSGVDQAVEEISSKKGEFDLIITDYSMPEKSGLDLGRYCRENFSSIPVVMCTGYGDDMKDSFSAEGGIVDVINKPFNLNELSTLISENARSTSPH